MSTMFRTDVKIQETLGQNTNLKTSGSNYTDHMFLRYRTIPSARQSQVRHRIDEVNIILNTFMI